METLTLYSSDVCPAAQRVIVALEEAGAEYTKYEVDPMNKPEWYVPKVNPATGKIPAITYGPRSDPTNPHPQSTKLTESLVLLAFIADLYPTSGLLPPDPVRRAHMRFIIDVFMNKVFGPFYATVLGGASPEGLCDGLVALQAQLDAHLEGSPFLGGERMNMADAAVAPFLVRIDAHFRSDVGVWARGEGPKVHAEIFGSERFGTLQRYIRALLARETVRSSFPEDKYLERFKAHIESMKKA
ncbi:unnamed protein product [Rhizoctonia solani]|uniref:Uncharacterized protein n=1 Tax=Rhizoctonia solani TaxID=456999 RepID=A0A8H3GQU9_9AGAM|nr:unnamed protein product [Rhizoctonia solani]